jgi:uncharacterized protein
MNERVVTLSRNPRRAKRKCPICGRPPQADMLPFCSRRCADEDLRRWLSGDYRVPTAERPENDDKSDG